MSLVLTIEQDTWLKRQITNARYLPDNDKLKVMAGEKFAPLSWELADSQHIKFYVSEKSYLYAFIPHILLTENGVNVLAVKAVVIEPLKQLVTAEQFYAIAPQTSLYKLVPLFEPLNIALVKYSINTPLRICHFLAQTCHESDQFNTNEEYASGEAYEGWTELGNTEGGDGVRFKGRSLICVTGRANYQAFSDYLGVDFVSNSTLLAAPKYAWLGAGWFWDTRNLNDLADQDRFQDITIRINGGTNGIEDRFANLERAKKVFGI